MVWVWDVAPLTPKSQPIHVADCCHFIRSKDSLFLCAWLRRKRKGLFCMKQSSPGRVAALQRSRGLVKPITKTPGVCLPKRRAQTAHPWVQERWQAVPGGAVHGSTGIAL